MARRPIAAAGRFTYDDGNGIASTTATAMAAALAIFALTSSATGHDCTCRHAGQSYAQGDVACIRDRLARCAMYLNNSSWTFVADSCPLVGLTDQDGQQRMTAVPAATVSR